MKFIPDLPPGWPHETPANLINSGIKRCDECGHLVPLEEKKCPECSAQIVMFAT